MGPVEEGCLHRDSADSKGVVSISWEYQQLSSVNIKNKQLCGVHCSTFLTGLKVKTIATLILCLQHKLVIKDCQLKFGIPVQNFHKLILENLLLLLLLRKKWQDNLVLQNPFIP